MHLDHVLDMVGRGLESIDPHPVRSGAFILALLASYIQSVHCWNHPQANSRLQDGQKSASAPFSALNILRCGQMSPDHVQLVPAHDQDPLRIFLFGKGSVA